MYLRDDRVVHTSQCAAVRQAQAAKSAGGQYDPEVVAKRTRRHLDELEVSVSSCLVAL